MTNEYSSNKIFEFYVKSEYWNEVMQELEKPGFTQEEVDECRKIAQIFKNNRERMKLWELSENAK